MGIESFATAMDYVKSLTDSPEPRHTSQGQQQREFDGEIR